MGAQRVSRRRAVKLLAAGAGGLLAGCGAMAADPLALDTAGFGGARLRGVVRRSFIDEINALTAAQAADWGSQVDAHLDLQISENWREIAAETAARRSGFDIAELFGPAPHVFGDRLLDVSSLAEELDDSLGGWADVARSAAMVDGVWRAIPWTYTAQAINVRSSVLTAVGSPSLDTYDDLLHAATLLRDGGLPLAGFSMSSSAPNDASNLAYSMLWAFGGQEVGEDGRVALDSEGTRRAVRFFRDLTSVSDPQAVNFDEGGNNRAFLEGRLAMTQNATSILWKARQSHPEIAADIDHFQGPAGPAGRHQLIEMNALVVFEHSRNQDAAIDWIRWTAAADRLRERAQISLGFSSPPLGAFDDDPSMPFAADPQLAGLHAVGEGDRMPGWPGPPNTEAGLVFANGSIVSMFGAVARGELGVDAAVTAAADELRRVYET